MRKIRAYQCEYCEKKVYTNRNSCYAHEKKCYWNPINKACASCGHYLYDYDGTQCLKGIDISNKLKYDCKDHRERTEDEKAILFGI
jgi:hypothetical protein